MREAPGETVFPRTHRGPLSVERTLRFLDGVLMLRQRFVGAGYSVIVTHDAAMRSLVEVRTGTVSFPLAGGEVIAPRRFVLAVPPRSVLPIRFEDADVECDGAGSTRALDDHAVPAIERYVVGTVLERGEVLDVLDADGGVPAPVRRARAHLHDFIDHIAPVRNAAARVRLAPETLARLFTATYGLAPKRYCQQARVFDAVLHLLGGSSILDAALRAGFNDLTRFYAQFRRRLGATPGLYVQIRNRQDRARAFAVR